MINILTTCIQNLSPVELTLKIKISHFLLSTEAGRFLLYLGQRKLGGQRKWEGR
jgi:hypothetical protein